MNLCQANDLAIKTADLTMNGRIQADKYVGSILGHFNAIAAGEPSIYVN